MQQSNDLLVADSHKHEKKSKKSKKKYKKKRKRYSSTSSEDRSSSDNSSSSSNDIEEVKHKAKKHKKKKLKKKLKKLKKELKKKTDSDSEDSDHVIGPAIPNNLVDLSKRMAPETKEEWEKRQNVVKRVYDEQTGRYRLIKGDGEILEEIVSKDRHQEINKQATIGDGEYFQSKLPQPKLK